MAQTDSLHEEVERFKETLNKYSISVQNAEKRDEVILQRTTYDSLLSILANQHEMLQKANIEIESIRQRLLSSDVQPLVSSDTIYFSIGSAALTENGKESIRRFVEANGTTKVYLINGHADPTGSKKSNQWISKLRALSVKKYMVVQLKLNEKNITANYYGSEKRVCDTNGASCNTHNRRVEMRAK